jgi:hypothetical protein
MCSYPPCKTVTNIPKETTKVLSTSNQYEINP